VATPPGGAFAFAVALVSALLGGCSKAPPGTAAPAVSVSISPTSASLRAAESASFTAFVSHASDTSVTWSADGGSVVGTGPTVTYTAPGTGGTYHVTVMSDQDGSKSATAVVTVSTSSGGGSTVTVAAAGDVACDPTDPHFNGGDGTSNACHMKATSDLLMAMQPDAVLVLGDDQYEDGALATFQQSYDPTWGRLKSVTHPAVGNHEYLTAGAEGYFAYFGSAAGDPGKGYYSYDVGDWHLIAINSNCSKAGGCASGSPQEQWLRADLAASSAACTLAYWHHPRYSSGEWGDNASMSDIWQALYDHGAEIVLSGHDHDYERFAPQDATGNLDAARGVRQFVVGTGGRNNYPVGPPIANSQVMNGDTYGVLKLTLGPTGFDWQFVPDTSGSSGGFTDSGTASCH